MVKIINENLSVVQHLWKIFSQYIHSQNEIYLQATIGKHTDEKINCLGKKKHVFTIKIS